VVRAALRRVTTSLAFGKSIQLAQFLSYVVEETLAGRAGRPWTTEFPLSDLCNFA
jgi:hypothetical protein